MIYGVCGRPDIAAIAQEAGYGFMEGRVDDVLMPSRSVAEFESAMEAVGNALIPTPVCNCFVPGHLKITGQDADLQALEAYAIKVFERAKSANVDTIVFGSGGARQIPDGFDRERADLQILEFSRMISPIAADNGVTIALEPLASKFCNVLNKVGEAADLVRRVDHPNFRLLVDALHWIIDSDSYDDVVAAGELLAHSHIATVPGGKAPGEEECDFTPFFSALQKGGYDGRLSVEAGLSDAGRELPAALRVMREYVEAVHN